MGGVCCKDGIDGEAESVQKKQGPAKSAEDSKPASDAAAKAVELAQSSGIPPKTQLVEPVVDDAPQAPSQAAVPAISPALAAAALPASENAPVGPEQVMVSEAAADVTSFAALASTARDSASASTAPANSQPSARTTAASNLPSVTDLIQVAPDEVAKPTPAVPPSNPGSPVASDSVQQGAPVTIETEPVLKPEAPGEAVTPFLTGALPTITEAGGSAVKKDPSAGDLTAEGRVRVETTRRNGHAAGPSPGDGSSSVSYSHSAASSQHPGSSQAQGSVGQGLSPMMGSSAAQGVLSTTGEAAATVTANNDTAVAGAGEAAGSTVSPSDTIGATPAAKQSTTGFMFGAPRVKEHKKDRKRADKRAKSHSSSSTQSGVPLPAGSDAITATTSKTSGSEPVNGRMVGGSSVAVPATGTNSIASTDVATASTLRPPAPGSSAGPSVGPMGGGADSTTGSASKDYRSIGRRIKPSLGKGLGSTDSGSGRVSSRDRDRGSSGASGTPPDGCTSVGVDEGVPEAVPEGDEGSEHSSSEQSSSEHLSIMSPPEGSDVENVLQLICNIFQLPVALVAAYRSANIFIRSTALKLTDDDQWRYSLAQWSMLNVHDLRDVLMVPNAPLDDRFRDYYCVKNEPRVRFFMASPLRSSTGELLGTLCMADFTERLLEPANLLVVNNLQTLVIKQLERDMSLAQERIENEVATEKLQQEMMRALDHFEKCIMFVDTSKPGWEVLYTNMAWEHVTGIPREHVFGRQLAPGPAATANNACVPRVHVVGRSLQDFFMALGGASLDWSSTAGELASRAEFTVHRVAVRQKPDKLVSLHLRLATSEASGELDGLLPKGLPNWVKARGNEAHNYFVFVEEVNPQAGNSTVYEALAKHVEKVPGLELSHLLGKGGFGSVYYGTWNGMPVAVKMIDNRLTKTNTDGVSLEALMGQELSHPNIVKTIKYVMRTARVTSSISTSTSRGMNSSAARHALIHSRNDHPSGTITSRHGSRNPLLQGISGPGSNGPNGSNHGRIPTSNTQGLTPYMTSAQPGLSGMTSAQMAAALDLTSASAMQHLNRLGTTMTSDATTVAGGGSQYSGNAGGTADLSQRSQGVPPNAANLIGSSAPTPPRGSLAVGGGGGGGGGGSITSATTSGLTAVGPASVQASSTSTAAGPPSIASASGQPANVSLTASTDVSGTGLANHLAQAQKQAAVGHGGHAVGSASGTIGAAAAAPAASAGGGAPAVPLPQNLPPLAAPAGAPAGASSITAAYPPGTPPPDLSKLTPEQQQAAMTSRFSLAFSTITSNGDVLVPGKGSHSPSSSSGVGMTQQMAMGSAGSGEDMGEVWIIMEFCDRGSLQDALDRGALKLRKPGGEVGETHLPMMVATACEVASALHYLHGKGIVHGDLTAWNVMLCTSQQDRSGRNFVAKVADFGLSRTLDVKSKIKTRTYGTISHMPPECLISGIISKATDVFAFGVLLWQMYTGLRPWAGMNHGQIIYNVGMKNVQLLFPPGTPPAIADLSSSCTRTEPSHRPSFAEIMDKLDNIRASLGL